MMSERASALPLPATIRIGTATARRWCHGLRVGVLLSKNGLSWKQIWRAKGMAGPHGRELAGHRHRGSGLFLFAATIQPSPDEDDG